MSDRSQQGARVLVRQPLPALNLSCFSRTSSGRTAQAKAQMPWQKERPPKRAPKHQGVGSGGGSGTLAFVGVRRHGFKSLGKTTKAV